MKPDVVAELERRGAANVRMMLAGDHVVGSGAGADVPLGLPSKNEPSREEVEAWLKMIDVREAAAIGRRHRHVLAWTVAGAVAAIIAAVASLLALRL